MLDSVIDTLLFSHNLFIALERNSSRFPRNFHDKLLRLVSINFCNIIFFNKEKNGDNDKRHLLAFSSSFRISCKTDFADFARA